MAFNGPGPGRPKGLINKKTKAFQQTLEEHNFDVAEALLDLYGKAIEAFNSCSEKDAASYLRIASDIVGDIASYSLPKLRAIEVKRTRTLDGMTNEQKLEAMKAAVTMLEGQIAKDEPTVE